VRRNLVVAAAAVAVAALTTVSAPAVQANQAVAAARAGTDIRVGSYNVVNVSLDKTSGEQRPWKQRRAQVIGNILGESVDVLGVQELNPSRTFASRLVDGKTQFTDLRNGLNKAGGTYALTNKYGYNCQNARTQYNCVKKNRGASNSDRILYNFETLEMLDQGKVKYKAQRADYSPTHMAWAVFRTRATGSEFLFTTTHLDPKNVDIRKAQWQQMIAKINRLKGSRPVIATGDFNTHKMNDLAKAMLPAMKNAGYGDVRGQEPGVTKLEHPRAEQSVNGWVNSVNRFHRDVRDFSYYTEQYRAGHNIDWIFATNALPVREWKTVVNFDPSSWQVTEGVLASDHNMVRATIGLP
jgi:endonuclease/exonuclease/phosphatase family metal-dependent hydrolase